MTEKILKSRPEPEAKELFCVSLTVNEEPIRICSENKKEMFDLWEVLSKPGVSLLQDYKRDKYDYSYGDKKQFCWCNPIDTIKSGPVLSRIKETIYPSHEQAGIARDTWRRLKEMAEKKAEREKKSSS